MERLKLVTREEHDLQEKVITLLRKEIKVKEAIVIKAGNVRLLVFLFYSHIYVRCHSQLRLIRGDPPHQCDRPQCDRPQYDRPQCDKPQCDRPQDKEMT